MLEGIKILSQETVMTDLWFGINGLSVLFFIGTLITAVWNIDTEIKKYIKVVLGIIPVIFLTTFVLGCLLGTKQIDYKVTIDDTITYQELVSEYKVLDQEGLIYTITER